MSWRYLKIHGVLYVLVQLKKSLFVIFNAAAESVNCSIYLENLEKHFCNLTYRYKKKFVKHVENLLQRLSEELIADNLSITDIALRNRDLSASPRLFGYYRLSF